MSGARRDSIVPIVPIVALLALALSVLTACRPGRPAPPPLSTLPDFTLVERDGSTVRRTDLLGAPWVADFVFTRCIAYCPRLTARMKELRARLPAEIRTVSFSVDPEHDTPAVLTEYARQWQIEGKSWLFLTGERAAVWSLVRKGFLLAVEEDPSSTGSNSAAPIVHSNRFVLVDSRGRMRSAVEAFDADAIERLLAELEAVRREEVRAR